VSIERLKLHPRWSLQPVYGYESLYSHAGIQGTVTEVEKQEIQLATMFENTGATRVRHISQDYVFIDCYIEN
jgi:hypothetical protein